MEQVTKLKRTGTYPQILQIIQKILENYCPCLYPSIQLGKFGDLMSCGSKDILKNEPCLMY